VPKAIGGNREFHGNEGLVLSLGFEEPRPIAQYVLDNYATVDEAVAALSRQPIYALPVMTPDGKPGNVHLSISDAGGDSAILEYVAGKLVIHHGRQFQVMTNSPVFDQQLALNKYWEQIGGTTMLPGTNRAADRFVRASFYINAVPKTSDADAGVAEVFSVMRNVSVPLGLSTPGQPNIASTLWRTVADQRDKVYYFESTRYPSIVWVKLADINFDADQPTRELKLAAAAEPSGAGGDVTAKFVPAQPFAFLPANPN